MNIQRSLLEGYVTPISGPGLGGGRSWADLLGEAGLGKAQSGAGRGPGRRSRVPDEDIVVVGPRRRDDGPAVTGPSPASDGPDQRRPALRVRTTLLLGVAAYYMAWGLLQGIAAQKPRAIHVNPTVNSKTIIT